MATSPDTEVCSSTPPAQLQRTHAQQSTPSLRTLSVPIGAKQPAGFKRTASVGAGLTRSISARDGREVGCVLRLATFNVLCPAYKRVEGGREAFYPEDYRKRHESILTFLKHHEPIDILCLQEYWFQEDLCRMYEEGFANHNVHTAQRPCRQDGLAIFMGPNIESIATREVNFKTIGCRIALMVHAIVYSNDTRVVVGNCIIATTHFSFPHGAEDEAAMLQQAIQLEEELTSFCEEQKCHTVIVTGDFNCNLESAPLQHLQQQGFQSMFGLKHSREAAVTHRSHRGDDVGVDFILLRSPPDPKALDVDVDGISTLPAYLGDETWPERFELSDHRPVVAKIAVGNEPSLASLTSFAPKRADTRKEGTVTVAAETDTVAVTVQADITMTSK
eukprot:m.86911 g.86911  ORF g.86911 m.86911 type:complete len:389 (+) comp12821_c0_seq1:199-1365(+)